MGCGDCSPASFDLKRKIIGELLPLLTGIISRDSEKVDSAARLLVKENVVYEGDTPKDEVSKSILQNIDDLKSSGNHFVVIDEDSKLKSDVESLRDQLNSHIRNVADEWNRLDKTIADIYETTNDLYIRYDNLEQYGRRETLEIHNVPQKSQDENTLNVVQDFFGSMMNETVRREDISTCHRLIVPNDKDNSNKHEDSKCPVIYVKFVQRDQKIHLLRKKWMLKGKRNSGGYSYFINENLTEKRRILFNVAKKQLREAGWQYVWTKNGNVKAKKGKAGKTVTIDSYEKLDSITKA